MKYKNIINKLKLLGIRFDSGLSDKEIYEIEKIYNISFPPELRDFYKCALPISNGFYNWRDFSKNNVLLIKGIMLSFFNDILEFSEELDWCINWGEEPQNKAERKNCIKRIMENAPKMIPIYSHRAIASVNIYNNPVFSISETDVIYYGKNIEDYLKNEFYLKKNNIGTLDEYTYIPFWSDIV